MRTFWVILKRINKYLLIIVILHIIWIYFYQIKWIKIPAKNEFWAITGQIYFAVALSIIAGYVIYFITTEVPLIRKRIAFNGQLIDSIGNLSSNIMDFTREFGLNFDRENLDDCINEIGRIDLKNSFQIKKFSLKRTEDEKYTFQDYLRFLYDMTKRINQQGREEIEKLYLFSYLLDSSFFKIASQFNTTELLDFIKLKDIANNQFNEFGIKKIDIETKDIMFQLDVCLTNNIKLYKFLHTEYNKYAS